MRMSAGIQNNFNVAYSNSFDNFQYPLFCMLTHTHTHTSSPICLWHTNVQPTLLTLLYRLHSLNGEKKNEAVNINLFWTDELFILHFQRNDIMTVSINHLVIYNLRNTSFSTCVNMSIVEYGNEENTFFEVLVSTTAELPNHNIYAVFFSQFMQIYEKCIICSTKKIVWFFANLRHVSFFLLNFREVSFLTENNWEKSTKFAKCDESSVKA